MWSALSNDRYPDTNYEVLSGILIKLANFISRSSSCYRLATTFLDFFKFIVSLIVLFLILEIEHHFPFALLGFIITNNILILINSFYHFFLIRNIVKKFHLIFIIFIYIIFFF